MPKPPSERTRLRRGQPSVQLTRAEFVERYRRHFFDPAFAGEAEALERLTEIAWSAYSDNRKAPRRRRAGRGWADPEYQLSVEWLAARAAIRTAERAQRRPRAPRRILLINGSPRSEHTCPGETSKSFRLVRIAEHVFEEAGVQCDLLDLSHLTSEYGRVIHPCKACVSTAMPLCHWPCSCYPNHAIGQVPDWMNEIYPRWSAAHGIMIVTPVHWHHAPSVLKLMIDRLVCADGGNPDPTTTHGKDPRRAKALELGGWDYPKHLAGRAFAVVVHADAEGASGLRRSLCDWLSTMGLVQAGAQGAIDRYVGYYEPYATSHAALDVDRAFAEEVRNAARSLVNQVRLIQRGRKQPDQALRVPRTK